jgi:hypothetical protein
MYQHVNIDDLARQAASLRRGWGRISGFLSQLDADHPFMVNRIRAVVDFVGHPAGGAPAMSGAPVGSPPAPPAVPVERPPSPPAEPAVPLAGGAAAVAEGAAPRTDDPPVARPARPVVSPSPPVASAVQPPPAASVVPPPPAPIVVPPPPARLVAPRPPAARSGGLLVVRTGPDAGRSYLLDERPRTLGRGSDCDLRWEDSALSRRHCQIRWEDEVYVLQDLGSSNGTHVNGAAVRRAILRAGDRLQIGSIELEFKPTAAPDQ